MRQNMSIAFQRDVNMIYASKAIAKNGKMKKSKTSKEALSSFILKNVSNEFHILHMMKLKYRSYTQLIL